MREAYDTLLPENVTDTCDVEEDIQACHVRCSMQFKNSDKTKAPSFSRCFKPVPT